jgi:hypothetical protein
LDLDTEREVLDLDPEREVLDQDAAPEMDIDLCKIPKINQ